MKYSIYDSNYGVRARGLTPLEVLRECEDYEIRESEYRGAPMFELWLRNAYGWSKSVAVSFAPTAEEAEQEIATDYIAGKFWPLKVDVIADTEWPQFVAQYVRDLEPEEDEDFDLRTFFRLSEAELAQVRAILKE
jgi:hypothetical protein